MLVQTAGILAVTKTSLIGRQSMKHDKKKQIMRESRKLAYNGTVTYVILPYFNFTFVWQRS